MAKKRVFTTDFTETPGPTDPEAVFRNLRGRAPEIKHLWSQQADLLRAYHQEHLTARDVAIELPTGAGKTLVGLLIAEWRRHAEGEGFADDELGGALAKRLHVSSWCGPPRASHPATA